MNALAHYYVRNKLTNKLISKRVLSPISRSLPPPADLVKALSIEAEVAELLAVFNQYQAHDDEQVGLPRYMPFYRFIQSKFPGFQWQERTHEGRRTLVLDKPYINQSRPSLLNLLLCAVNDNTTTTPAMKVRYPATQALPDGLVQDLELAFETLSFAQPAPHFMARFADALLRGLAGETVTLISPVCPDYGYEAKNGRFRYTFEQLGEGIGLVAGRVVKTLPVIRQVLEKHGIRTQLAVAPGDFEGFDPGTLTRLKETREGFARKLRISQGKILEQLGADTETLFIAEAAGGEAAWDALTAGACARLAAGDNGHIVEGDLDYGSIFNARLPLYQAWHQHRSNDQLMQVLYSQGAEYAAMGQVFARQWENPIVIGADHNRMQPFYWLYTPIPVLYLTRVY
ncbi:hypothetical protein [Pseudomonas japonica]|uniref:hypothetical protein n=1 Tax=Pseudomonas japonica TaxID=256466 RepID=UPI0015E44BC3|nr:hypothetical protein [Pseudomonas japonica]MBA1243849.1 hypothetical protein [Pseudomonas japonica]MBA1288437.1 hypothetical protein [Pseudomonas japonica]